MNSDSVTRIRYSRVEAAQALSISTRSLDRLRAEGKLIARVDGGRIFFDRTELQSYANSCLAEGEVMSHEGLPAARQRVEVENSVVADDQEGSALSAGGKAIGSRRRDKRREQYEARRDAWIAEQLENCPPLNERQRELIRSAFAAHRRDKAAAAKGWHTPD
ncbi:helix-turn-helix domain-containing protein [Nocardia sp. NPDC004750]